MWEKQPCRHQGQWRRRGRRCSRHQSRDSPAARGKYYGEVDCTPAAHRGPWWSTYPPAAYGGPHAWAGRCAQRRLWPHGKPVLEQAPVRTCGPMRDPCWSSLFLRHCGKDWCWSSSWRTAAHGKDSHGKSTWRTVSYGRDPRLEQEKSIRSPPSERKRATETTCDELAATPIPCPLALLVEEEVEKIGSEVEPGKKGGVREGVLRFCFISHYPTLFCLVINLIFPKLSLFCP